MLNLLLLVVVLNVIGRAKMVGFDLSRDFDFIRLDHLTIRPGRLSGEPLLKGRINAVDALKPSGLQIFLNL